jgi:NADP-dependent alcohol dehydrogenase
MENFEFFNSVRVIFGKNALDKLGDKISGIGKRVLLVYGKGSIKKIGLYDKVVGILQEASMEIVEFGGVKPNPVLSHTREGIKLARTEKVDCILAVGGGSVIDEAKAISAGALYDGNVWDFYTGDATITKTLPMMTVLTVPATGTEMNGGTVITNEETGDKFGFITESLQPEASFMDPTVTFSISKEYTAYSGIDAISHCIEGYFTNTNGWAPVQDRYIEGLVQAIMESIEAILEKPDNYDARASFMWAATLAWNGLSVAGLENAQGPAHMLGHPLSALYDLAHGATLSITTPAWMRWALENGNGNIEKFARKVFGITAEDDNEAARLGIEALKGWFVKIGSPVTLKEAGIPDSDVDRIVDKAFDLAQVWGMNVYTKDVIRKIFSYCES